MQQVSISLSSFGAAEVRRHGQAWFAKLALEAGVDGVEVRGELLNDAASELPAIAEAVRGSRAALVYSSPEGIWQADGCLDDAAVQRGIAAAKRLGAARLKMSIGGFAARSAASIGALARMQDAAVELVVENDQTPQAGTVDALRRFFDAADAQGVRIGMTFDMGNWQWLGECPLAAAQAFAPRVTYVHCKGVQRLPAKWVAVPIADSSAPWRAVLRAMPRNVPWAIEYPLVGDDLLAVTRSEIAVLRDASALLQEME